MEANFGIFAPAVTSESEKKRNGIKVINVPKNQLGMTGIIIIIIITYVLNYVLT
jgi:hypothetical protein